LRSLQIAGLRAAVTRNLAVMRLTAVCYCDGPDRSRADPKMRV
jgi:hypothetical protein